MRAGLARYGNARGRWRSIAAHHLHGRPAAALPRLWKEALGALHILQAFCTSVVHFAFMQKCSQPERLSMMQSWSLTLDPRNLDTMVVIHKSCLLLLLWH